MPIKFKTRRQLRLARIEKARDDLQMQRAAALKTKRPTAIMAFANDTLPRTGARKVLRSLRQHTARLLKTDGDNRATRRRDAFACKFQG